MIFNVVLNCIDNENLNLNFRISDNEYCCSSLDFFLRTNLCCQRIPMQVRPLHSRDFQVRRWKRLWRLQWRGRLRERNLQLYPIPVRERPLHPQHLEVRFRKWLRRWFRRGRLVYWENLRLLPIYVSANRALHPAELGLWRRWWLLRQTWRAGLPAHHVPTKSVQV